jgi:thymidylate kinase
MAIVVYSTDNMEQKVVRLSLRPSGKTVAIIGPDGAGKSTLIDKLENGLPFSVKRIYMGVNPAAATHALPTTRFVWFLNRVLKRPRPNYDTDSQPQDSKAVSQKSGLKLVFSEIKSALFVFNRVSEQWYRQWVCWYYQWRGHVVLIDRHFYLDYLAVKLSNPVKRQVMAWRIHDFLIERAYPRPNLTLYLDAPPEVLFARKQEVSLARLETMRRAYNQIREHVPAFEALDATQSADQVYEVAKHKIIAMTE